jgi:predicted small secreted protein
MKNFVRMVLGSILVLVTIVALPACNTVKGAGEDLQDAAEGTERAIEKATN